MGAYSTTTPLHTGHTRAVDRKGVGGNDQASPVSDETVQQGREMSTVSHAHRLSLVLPPPPPRPLG